MHTCAVKLNMVCFGAVRYNLCIMRFLSKVLCTDVLFLGPMFIMQVAYFFEFVSVHCS